MAPETLLSIAFILPKVNIENQAGIAIIVMSKAHMIQSSIDRYYVLLICSWILIGVSLELLQSNQNSSVFMLFNQQWFVTLWNDIQDDEADEVRPYHFKEEVCLSYCLLVQIQCISYYPQGFSVSYMCITSTV